MDPPSQSSRYTPVPDQPGSYADSAPYTQPPPSDTYRAQGPQGSQVFGLGHYSEHGKAAQDSQQQTRQS
jgi:hypothetical protein